MDRTGRLLLTPNDMSSFRTLEKVILSNEQLTAFKSSKTYAKITSYIGTLNDAVVELKLTDECAQSQVRPIPLGSRISRCFTGLLTGQRLRDY